MKLLTEKYYLEYQKLVGQKFERLISVYQFPESIEDLGYRTQVSAVYSSNIEGNSIDLNSFMNHKLSPSQKKNTKEIQEIEDLTHAYQFAQSNQLSETNLFKAHAILSKSFLIKSFRGKYRDDKIGVFSESGLVYLAIEVEFVASAMEDLFSDIDDLINAEISIAQAFYYASMIHLRFVHIHPFRDGNGRVARLLEKWFLASKLGTNYWNLLSEKYYKEHQQEYYNNINLGVNYYFLNYDLCLPFLQMLPLSMA